MIRIPRFRTKRVGKFVINFGNPFVACEKQPLLIPIQRNDKFKNELLSASGQSSFTRALANAASAVVADKTFDIYVCIYIEQSERVENNRVACHTQLQGGERGHCSYLFTINITNCDGGMPSEESIQTVSMIMHAFLTDRKNRSVAFFIGCLKGLNRTGYMCCAVLNRLFGADVHRAHVLYRAAHYPGIVKQSFVSGLLARYATRAPSEVHILDRITGNFAFHNLVHKDVHGDSMVEEHSSKGSTQPLPLLQPVFVKISKGHIQWGVHLKCGRHDGDFLRRLSCSGATAALRSMIGWTRSIVQQRDFPVDRCVSMLRSGFSKTVPLTVSAVGFDGVIQDERTIQSVKDMAVSIKADGTHGTLFVAPYGAYLLLRGDEINDDPSRQIALHSLPIWAKTSDASPFVKSAMLECEVVECGTGGRRLLCFDMLMGEDWDRNTTHSFETRTTMMREYFDGIDPNTLQSQSHNITGAISIEMKPFYFASSNPEAFGHIMLLENLDTHFGWLARNGKNDGLVLSRASANIIINEREKAHMKIKTHHTIDLLVDRLADELRLYCGSGRQLLLVAAYNSDAKPDYSFTTEDGQTLAVRVTPATVSKILDIYREHDGNSVYIEFKVIIGSNALLLSVVKKRTDITQPNAKLTVDSCVHCTVSQMEKELPANIANVALALANRKRKRGP